LEVIGAFALGIATYLLFRSSVKANQQADLHHRQGCSGIMVINDLSLKPLNGAIYVLGVIKNVGLGPALQIAVYVKYPSTIEMSTTTGAWGAAEEHVLYADSQRKHISIPYMGAFSLLKTEDALVRLEWITMFGTIGKSWYKWVQGHPTLYRMQTPDGAPGDEPGFQ
jgi:hypothetical protein